MARERTLATIAQQAVPLGPSPFAHLWPGSSMHDTGSYAAALIERLVSHAPHPWRTNVMRVAGISLSILTLAWTFRDADPQRVASLLERVGGAGILILLPQLASLFIEALGWCLAFEQMKSKLSWWGLFRARLATEALAQTLPLGVVLCESMKPLLLARTCGADLGTSLAGIAARKWLLVTSQSIYVGLFAVLGGAAMAGVAAPLPYALLSAAGLLGVLSLTGYALLARAVEVAASFLRNLAFMVPAGLGVQDVGYVALLRGLSVPDVVSAAAAFLLLKRSKEAAWAVVGYAILALELRSPLGRRTNEHAMASSA